MTELIEKLIKDVEDLPVLEGKELRYREQFRGAVSVWIQYEGIIEREKVLKLLKDFQIVFEDEFEDQRRENNLRD